MRSYYVENSTRQLFQEIYICRCKKRSQGEQISTTARIVVREFTSPNTLYQVLSFAVSAKGYIAEFIGTTEARNQLYGDALIGLRKKAVTALHRQ